MMKIKFVVILLAVSLQPSLQQFERLQEGETCLNPDGIQGVCTRFKECPTAVAAIRKKQRPRTCSFVNSVPIICCPPGSGEVIHSPNKDKFQGPVTPSILSIKPTQAPNTCDCNCDCNDREQNNLPIAIKIANQKCAEYGETVRELVDDPAGFSDEKIIVDHCARIETPLIVGGITAKPKEFPHMAQIGYGESAKWRCGGSLISEKFVISAAHCSSTSLGPAKWVKLGELNQATDDDDASPVVIRIIKRFEHPGYRLPKLYNDIALFQLQHPVLINPYIRPICLSTKTDLSLKTALASGWGRTAFDSKGSNDLLKVRLNLVSEGRCNREFRKPGDSRQLPEGIINSQICAGGQVGKDTCQGDSGGPLQSPIDNPYCMYELIGVTSFGRKCGDVSPGVYTRVVHFLPWIVKIVWPELLN